MNISVKDIDSWELLQLNTWILATMEAGFSVSTSSLGILNQHDHLPVYSIHFMLLDYYPTTSHCSFSVNLY